MIDPSGRKGSRAKSCHKIASSARAANSTIQPAASRGSGLRSALDSTHATSMLSMNPMMAVSLFC